MIDERFRCFYRRELSKTHDIQLTEWEERLGCILPDDTKKGILDYCGYTFMSAALFAKPSVDFVGRIDSLSFVSFSEENTYSGMDDFIFRMTPDVLPGYFPFCQVGETKNFFVVCCRPQHYGEIFLKSSRSDDDRTLSWGSSKLYVPYAVSFADFLSSTRTFSDDIESIDHYELHKMVRHAQSLADLPERLLQLPWK